MFEFLQYVAEWVEAESNQIAEDEGISPKFATGYMRLLMEHDDGLRAVYDN